MMPITKTEEHVRLRIRARRALKRALTDKKLSEELEAVGFDVYESMKIGKHPAYSLVLFPKRKGD